MSPENIYLLLSYFSIGTTNNFDPYRSGQIYLPCDLRAARGGLGQSSALSCAETASAKALTRGEGLRRGLFTLSRANDTREEIRELRQALLQSGSTRTTMELCESQ
jgi:hypothetical protein